MSTNTEDLVIGEGDVAKAQELHQRGLTAEAEGDRISAIEAYREAVAESPLTESRFRLAWLLDLMILVQIYVLVKLVFFRLFN